jgi:hypothetical protein
MRGPTEESVNLKLTILENFVPGSRLDNEKAAAIFARGSQMRIS